MIYITPNVPCGCEVAGRLYWDEDQSILGEDMVDVQLPNGILVSCGWYPESDAEGRYRITVSEGFEHLLDRETREVDVACSIVEACAEKFCYDRCVVVDATNGSESDFVRI